MKALIIHGSPRKGNTWNILDAFKKQLSTLGDIEYKEVFLQEENIPMCTGCFNCFSFGEDKCSHYKYMKPITASIEEADILIITSPVYSLNVSGLLKNFIDHCSYFFHRPRFFNKRAVVITTTAGAGASKVAGYLKDTLMHWGFNNVYTLAIYCRSFEYKVTNGDDKKIKTIAENVTLDFTKNRLKSPSLKRVLYYNIWRGISITHKSPKNKDTLYWIEEKLIEYPFSPKTPIGFLKRIFGNTIFKIIKRTVK